MEEGLGICAGVVGLEAKILRYESFPLNFGTNSAMNQISILAPNTV